MYVSRNFENFAELIDEKSLLHQYQTEMQQLSIFGFRCLFRFIGEPVAYTQFKVLITYRYNNPIRYPNIRFSPKFDSKPFTWERPHLKFLNNLLIERYLNAVNWGATLAHQLAYIHLKLLQCNITARMFSKSKMHFITGKLTKTLPLFCYDEGTKKKAIYWSNRKPALLK